MLEKAFTIISIFYAFRSLQIAAKVIREWAKLRGPDFTPQFKNLAGQASFFLAVPVGVLIHELGHALFVKLFGGEITGYIYWFFWGEVDHIGNYTGSQRWLISLAGTLGSLIFGVFIWFVLKENRSPTFRYFGLQAFRYQIYFSLIYYPIFTAFLVIGESKIGDWLTIYNFNSTPILSGATAVFHAGMLLLFWRADRSGFFEMGAFISEEAKEKVAALENQVAANPYDPALQLQLIDAYRRGGMPKEATQLVQKFLKENPHSAEGHLQLAILEAGAKERIPDKARDEAQKAISLGLSKPEAVAAAHQLVGRYAFGRGKVDEATDHYNQAIKAIQGIDKPNLLVSLLYYRGLTYRRKEQYEAAYQDVQQAINLAQSKNMEGAVKILNTELETISRHKGQPSDQSKKTSPFR